MKPFSEQKEFEFWIPGAGETVATGPERLPVPLPEIPLPVHRQEMSGGGRPDDDSLGRGLYDFLRRHPDHEYGPAYAGLLKEAFPHYLAEIGAQAVMIDAKETDAPYLRRKIVCLQILELLEPQNAGLLLQLGRGYYDLALMFTELADCRRHLLKAMGYLARALVLKPRLLPALLWHGEMDLLLGDFPAARRRWETALEALSDEGQRRRLLERIEGLAVVPSQDHPLVDDLERLGHAMQLLGNNNWPDALVILEGLETGEGFPPEFPAAEFNFLLGRARELSGDPGGAFAAYDKALELDPELAPALAGRERIVEGRDVHHD